MVNAGGAIAGMKVSASTSDTGVSNSNVVFLADQFTIKTASGTKQPFTVSGDVVSIDGTLKIGSSTASSIVTKANSATQASDHATIQAGTTAANVGLANVVNSNFDANGDVIGGAVGGTTINSTKIFQGTGTFGNANTGFYLDNGGNFSLKNKLVFNGSTGDLSIAGAITATSGSIANGVLIGGTAASTVESKANASTTATAAATAANSASKNAGAIGPVSITSTVLKQGSVAVASAFGHADTGFYFDNLGRFSLRDKLTVDSSGNLSIAGAISATSGSIADGVTIGGTAASTVKSGAASGATANQTSNADIRAVGAATSGTIAGISISGSELYQGVGTFGNANTGFYLGSNGTFSLKDKLSWNGTTLTINGNGTFSGNISAATGTFGGGVSGTGYTLNNSGLSLTNASSSISLGNSVILNSNGLSGTGFALTSTGLVASSANITGAITATSGSFTGTINASGGTFSGALSSASGDFTGEIIADEGTIGGWIINSGVLKSSSSDVKINSGSGSSGIEMFDSGTLRLKISPTGSVTNPLAGGGTSVSNQSQEQNEYLSLNSSVFAGSFSNVAANPATINLRTSTNAAGGTLFYNSRTSGQVGGTAGSTVGYTLVIPQDSGILSVAATGTRTGWSISAIFGVQITNSSTPGAGTVIADHSFSVSSTGLGLPHSAQTFTGSFVAPSGNYRVHTYIKKVRIVGTLTTEAGGSENVTSVLVRAPAVTVSAVVAIQLSELTSGGLLVSKGTDAFLRVDRVSNSSSNPFMKSKGFFNHNGTILIGDTYYLKIAQPTSSTSDLTFNKNTTGAYIFKTSGGDKFEIRDNGNIYADSIAGNLSGTNYTLKWKYYGSGSANNGEFYYTNSSKRYKKNIENYDISVIDKIKNINVKTFRYNQWADDDEKAIGLIAEDLHDAGINQVVVYGDEGVVDAIDYEKLNVILWKGMQEQQAIIESQKTLIDNLTQRVTALEG
jgi:hypothetical protein